MADPTSGKTEPSAGGRGQARLRNPPIVEAIVDIDCDLLPGFDLATLQQEAVRRLEDRYPQPQTLYMQKIEVAARANSEPTTSATHSAAALRLFQADRRQLVQVRAEGFSFNRLAPYEGLDDYLPEIRRVWEIYRDLARPVQVRTLRLRYINRIPLPMMGGQVNLDRYLTIAPRLPDEEGLGITSFLVQQSAIERKTGEAVSLVLTDAAATEDRLDVILDIAVENTGDADPADWQMLEGRIGSLRNLKNRIFWKALTDECITLLRT